jgi:hypothetical protein
MQMATRPSAEGGQIVAAVEEEQPSGGAYVIPDSRHFTESRFGGEERSNRHEMGQSYRQRLKQWKLRFFSYLGHYIRLFPFAPNMFPTHVCFRKISFNVNAQDTGSMYVTNYVQSEENIMLSNRVSSHDVAASI